MNYPFLFNSRYIIEETTREYTIVFFHTESFDFDDFTTSIDDFFQEQKLPERMFLVLPEYVRKEFEGVMDVRIVDVSKVIPTNFNSKEPFDFLSPIYYDSKGNLSISKAVKEKIDLNVIDVLFNRALVDIFKEREGLIKAEKAHHFVFPSGKHCDYFLRTGNILQKGNEIFFIAFNILKNIKNDIRIIYCDTSSINSIAFALIELKRRFKLEGYISPYLESFSSYSAFEHGDFTFLTDSLFLISSSTSSRIIKRLLERKVDLEQIVLIFCMGRKSEFKANIICDLLFNESTNPYGIPPFTSYEKGDECELCKIGSIAIEVTGDVFQLEKPKVNSISIKVTDAPKFHAEFMRSFYRRKDHNFSFIKSHHYERLDKPSLAQPSYEIFLDVAGLIKNIEKFKLFKQKLDKYITQYVPSLTSFIIYLPDAASFEIANYIKDKLSTVVKDVLSIELINQNEIHQNQKLRDSSADGTALVVCSSVVSGARLLYISREMRDYAHLSLVYFVGFSRTEDEQSISFIKSNLTMGKYGITTNSFIELERIFTTNERRNTAWIVEEHFLTLIKNYCEDKDEGQFKEAISFFNNRITTLENAYLNGGLSDDLFYPNILQSSKPLAINKNFAFYRFEGYFKNASQADINFSISVLLNQLRNNNDNGRKLINSQFVRTVLEPENFSRFNDGIIQASFLRSAHFQELCYDLDKKLSNRMLTILLGVIEFSNEDHGEALLEFLYAIAIKKLRLKHYHLSEIYKKILDHSIAGNNIIIKAFVEYCQEALDGSKEFREKYGLKLDY